MGKAIMAHVRIQLIAFDFLRPLPPLACKIWLMLAKRADNVGVCFPSHALLANDSGCNARTIPDTLDVLHGLRFFIYLRRDGKDDITGKRLPNIYAISPYLLDLPLETKDQALHVWQRAIEGAGYPLFYATEGQQNPETLWSPDHKVLNPTLWSGHQYNQQQNYLNELPPSNQRQETNNNNQPTALENKKANSKSEKPTAPSIPQPSQQPKAEHGSSAAAKKYVNPEPRSLALEDGALEALAKRVHALNIPLALGRGLVCQYGGVLVEKALLQLDAIRKAESVESPSGMFRYLLQTGGGVLVEDVGNKYTDGQYSDFIES